MNKETLMGNIAIIVQERIRLGIPESLDEQKRWQENAYDWFPEKPPIDETATQEASRRVITTMRLMEESENPYFRESIRYFQNLVRTGEASYTVDLRKKMFPPIYHADVMQKDNRLHFFIGIPIEEVMHNSNSAVLASVFVHEIEHVKNMFKFQELLPIGLSVRERIREEGKRQRDPLEIVAEEARGHGAAAQAYIYQACLLLYTFTDVHTRNAAMFIKSGSDVSNQNWRDFVATIIS